MWSQFREIKKFTAKDEVDYYFGANPIQFGNLPIYYYGKGFLIGYLSKKYQIQDIKRSNSDEIGKLAIRIYHFADIQALKLNYKVTDFFVDDLQKFDDNIINEFVTYNSTFTEVLNWMTSRFHNTYYTSGETRRLIDNKEERVNRFIMYGQYKLFFLGNDEDSEICGFEFSLS